jgi:hypothetical protein
MREDTLFVLADHRALATSTTRDQRGNCGDAAQ